MDVLIDGVRYVPMQSHPPRPRDPDHNPLVSESLSVVFRNARTESGLTLREVAVRVNFSNPYLSQIEMGVVARPSFLAVVRLARLYGLNLDDLAAIAEKDPDR
jgi:ribosome-binding protein aMBF1 (putative translation factor)